MRIDELQEQVEETAIYRGSDPVGFYMLGLAGEVGSLLTAWKKRMRDGDIRESSLPVLSRELGDVLWYTAQIANELNVQLDESIEAVIEAANKRWLPKEAGERFLDGFAPVGEQLPRVFVAELDDVGGRVELKIDGVPVGDPLSDNSHYPDEYRFHDIFHLAHAAILGWSPVLRAQLKRKRKYDTRIDDVEDGARAIFTEEGITALIFGHASGQAYFENARHVDTWLLDDISRIVDGLEVAQRSAFEWEVAILEGYKVWREVSRRGGGRVECDLRLGTITPID